MQIQSLLEQLPQTESGYDSVVVDLDKVSERAILASFEESIKRIEMAQIFEDLQFSVHGVPIKKISYKDSRFSSNFWKLFAELLKI